MAVSKRIADAEYVIQVMENEGVEPNVITYTTLIRGYTKMSDMEGAENVVDWMVEHGVARNDFTYNTLQQGYLRVGDFDAAHGILTRMEEDGVSPDPVTFVQLIAGYAKKGRVGEAESVFASMPMVPTLKAYLALARAYVNASDFYGMDGVLDRCIASHGCLSPELEALARMRRTRS